MKANVSKLSILMSLLCTALRVRSSELCLWILVCSASGIYLAAALCDAFVVQTLAGVAAGTAVGALLIQD